MEVKMSKLKSGSRLMTDNDSKDSFLKDSAIATREYYFSEFELAMPNTQEIEERVSKSFLAIDAFASEINSGSGRGSGSGSGTGTGGMGSGGGSGSGSGGSGGGW
jgi:hypothetical protein